MRRRTVTIGMRRITMRRIREKDKGEEEEEEKEEEEG